MIVVRHGFRAPRPPGPKMKAPPHEGFPARRLVRQAGSSIEIIEEQPEKAPSPRLVRPAGSSIDINCRSKAKDGTGWYMGGYMGGPENAERQRDRRHRGAAIKGALTNAREAGGQLNRRH